MPTTDADQFRVGELRGWAVVVASIRGRVVVRLQTDASEVRESDIGVCKGETGGAASPVETVD
jgi:hypothetical protein